MSYSNDIQRCPVCKYRGHEDDFSGAFCKDCRPHARTCQSCGKWCDKRKCSYDLSSIVCKKCYEIYECVKDLVEETPDSTNSYDEITFSFFDSLCENDGGSS